MTRAFDRALAGLRVSRALTGRKVRRLTDEQKREIKRLYRKVSPLEIMRRVGCGKSSVERYGKA